MEIYVCLPIKSTPMSLLVFDGPSFSLKQYFRRSQARAVSHTNIMLLIGLRRHLAKIKCYRNNIFDRFDAFLAKSNVSFQVLISRKIALLGFFDRCENKDELELKWNTEDN